MGKVQYPHNFLRSACARRNTLRAARLTLTRPQEISLCPEWNEVSVTKNERISRAGQRRAAGQRERERARVRPTPHSRLQHGGRSLRPLIRLTAARRGGRAGLRDIGDGKTWRVATTTDQAPVAGGDAVRRYSALMRRASSSWSSRMMMRQAASMGVPWSTSSRARAAMRNW